MFEEEATRSPRTFVIGGLAEPARMQVSGPGDDYELAHMSEDGSCVARLSASSRLSPSGLAARLHQRANMTRSSASYQQPVVGDRDAANTVDVIVAGQAVAFHEWTVDGEHVLAGKVGSHSVAMLLAVKPKPLTLIGVTSAG